MKPDGPPVNYGIIIPHSSLLGSKAKTICHGRCPPLLVAKKLSEASPMPHVLGRLSAWGGMVGSEWEAEGNSAFRKPAWPALGSPSSCELSTAAVPTSEASERIPLLWNFREEGSLYQRPSSSSYAELKMPC